jgi:hypothetical protein
MIFYIPEKAIFSAFMMQQYLSLPLEKPHDPVPLLSERKNF